VVQETVYVKVGEGRHIQIAYESDDATKDSLSAPLLGQA